MDVTLRSLLDVIQGRSIEINDIEGLIRPVHVVEREYDPCFGGRFEHERWAVVRFRGEEELWAFPFSAPRDAQQLNRYVTGFKVQASTKTSYYPL